MNKKLYRLILLITAFCLTLIVCFQLFIELYIPNNYKFFVGEERKLGYRIPVEAELSGEIQGVLQINNEAVPNDRISIRLDKTYSILSNKTGKFNVNLKFLGFFPIKQVSVEVINPEHYIPVGQMVGVTVTTDGVLVLGTGTFINQEGKKESPSKNILLSGDYIKKVNHIEISNKDELIELINASNGKELLIEIDRKGTTLELYVTPSKTSIPNEYKLGIWVRDDTQGIGTLTYVNVEENTFGALGHGITDVDTGQLIKLAQGTIVTSLVTNITKGQDGIPGEISGIIIESEENTVAKIIKNSQNGIFGKLTKNGKKEFSKDKSIPLGFKYEIKLGKAYIRSDINGSIEDYEINIEKIFLNDETNKGIIIKVVDSKLLNLTNGIIQGMSGSPIIQEGKLIGAVTHVFVQDSTKGYGTFIENMILEEN